MLEDSIQNGAVKISENAYTYQHVVIINNLLSCNNVSICYTHLSLDCQNFGIKITSTNRVHTLENIHKYRSDDDDGKQRRETHNKVVVGGDAAEGEQTALLGVPVDRRLGRGLDHVLDF